MINIPEYKELTANGLNSLILESQKPESVSKLLQISDKIYNNLQKKLIKPKPIVTINDIPIVFPYAITLIQGQKGSFKSMIVGMIASIVICKNKNLESVNGNLHLDTIDSKETILVYIDTERDLKNGFPYAIKKILYNAKIIDSFNSDSIPKTENFIYTSLAEIETDLRQTYIIDFLDYLNQTNNKHIICIIDVATDLGIDFNKSNDSVNLMQFFNRLINLYEYTFIIVIHENQTGKEKKARGHFGSEALNKSVTSFSCIAKNGFLEFQNLHQRYYKKSESLHFKYNESFETLELTNENDVITIFNDSINEIIELIKENFICFENDNKDFTIATTIKATDLEKFISLRIGIKSNSIVKQRLNHILNEKIPIPIKETNYYLYKSKLNGHGNIYFYRLLLESELNNELNF